MKKMIESSRQSDEQAPSSKGSAFFSRAKNKLRRHVKRSLIFKSTSSFIAQTANLFRNFLIRRLKHTRKYVLQLRTRLIRYLHSQNNNSPRPYKGLTSILYPVYRKGKSIPLLKYFFSSPAGQNYLNRSNIFSKNVILAIQDRSFDIVINSDNITLEAGYNVAQMTGAKRIYDAIELPYLDTRAGDGFEQFSRRELDIIHNKEARFINDCEAITVIGPSFKKWFSENYKISNIEIVRNCRQFEPLHADSPIKTDLNLKSSDILILFINGVYQDQGIEQVLQAIQELPENVHFATLGPLSKSDYLHHIQAFAQKCGVEKRFHFIPAKPWEEMLAYASGADIGIIPRQPSRLNNYLSLPNRIFELIMARLPVASTSLPDIADIVQKYNIGVIFDEKNPAEIAKAIRVMLHDDNLREYKKNINTAASELCWEKEKYCFLSFVENLYPLKKPLNILFLSRKDISKNNRVYRLSKTLTDAGHTMVIAAPFPPGSVQRDKAAKYLIASDKISPAIKKEGISPKESPSLKRKALLFPQLIPFIIKGRFFLPRLVFIIGSPRSGTHLLNSVLSSSSKTTPLLTESWPLVHLTKTFGFIGSHTNRYPGHYFEDAYDCRRFFSNILTDFVTQLHKRYKKPYIIFRVPYLSKSIKKLEQILKFSGLRYNIFVMVRDPRDVIASLVTINKNLTALGEEGLTQEISNLCHEYIAAYYAQLNHNTLNNLTFIRYEDLSAHPREEAARIGKILNLDLSQYSPESEWQNVKENWIKESDNKQTAWVTPLYKQKVSNSSIGRYKKILTQTQIAEVEKTLADHFIRFNYPLCQIPLKKQGAA